MFDVDLVFKNGGLGKGRLPIELVTSRYFHSFKLKFPIRVMDEGRKLTNSRTRDYVQRTYFVDDFARKFFI